MKRTPLKRKTPLKRGGNGLRKTRLSPVSKARAAGLAVYRALRAFLTPHYTCCARCEQNAWEDLHHPYKRGKGRKLWKLLCVMPVCRRCHDEIHSNENQAREDGWLVEPKPRR